MTDLGTLGGESSEALGINNSGQVVGKTQTKSGQTHAYLWQADRGMLDIGTLGGKESAANGINNVGQVVGYANTADGSRHAFLWQAGQEMQDLGTLGRDYSAANGIRKGIVTGGVRDMWDVLGELAKEAGSRTSVAWGINDKGEVVGISFPYRSERPHAFLWQAGQGMQDLGTLGGEGSIAKAINNAGQVVGMAETGHVVRARAFLWRASRGMKDLGTLTDGFTTAHGLNNSGQVVGESCVGRGSHGFVWQPGRGMEDIGSLGTESAGAYGINSAGHVVGGPAIGANSSHPAFLYSGGRMTDLNTMIDPSSGWRLLTATAINDSGQIVGTGRNKAGQSRAFLLTPVPEQPTPSSGGAVQPANPLPPATAKTPASPETASNGPEVRPDEKNSADTEYQNWIRQQAKSFRPNGLTEVERIVDGKKVLYLYFRSAPAVVSGPVSEMANYMQAEALRQDRTQQRKAIAEASGKYDEVVISEIDP